MLSEELPKEYGKGFRPRAPAYYRQFYLAFPGSEILHTCVQNPAWSHVRELIRVNDPLVRNWYMLVYEGSVRSGAERKNTVQKHQYAVV